MRCLLSRKEWKCLDCGATFVTGWIPQHLVRCPKCGSNNVVRVDPMRGKGFGKKRRRGLCVASVEVSNVRSCDMLDRRV